MKKTHKFENAIRDIFAVRRPFGYDGISEYREDTHYKEIGFRVEEGFNAEKLFALSDLLGVTNISVTGEYENFGGCPTCGDDITKYVEIVAHDVDFERNL